MTTPVPDPPVPDKPLAVHVYTAPELAEFSELLRVQENVGRQMKMRYRTRAHGHFIPEGQWVSVCGTVAPFGEYYPDKPCLEVQEVVDDQVVEGETVLVPFPSPDCEYCFLSLQPGAVSRKRVRDVQQVSSPMGDNDTSRALRSVLIEAKLKKPTCLVEGGEGLRIPAENAKPRLACVVPLWMHRAHSLVHQHELNDLRNEWLQMWRDFATEVGVIRNPKQRLEFEATIRSLTATVFLPEPPASRLDWLCLITMAQRAVATLATVAFGIRAATQFEAAVAKALDEDNFCDMIGCYRTVEHANFTIHSPDQPSGATATPTNNPAAVTVVDTRAMQATINNLAARQAAWELEMSQGDHWFRGRGRGARGGAGGQTHRGRGNGRGRRGASSF